MDKEDAKALYRILQLTIIKDSPDDDAYDALEKIRDVAKALIKKHNIGFADVFEDDVYADKQESE